MGAGYTVWRIVEARGELIVSGTIEADDIHVGSKIGGRVLKVVARGGQNVKAGEVLVLLEAMKIQIHLKAAEEGVVAEVLLHEGENVNAGDLLLRLAPAEWLAFLS